jgi:hypothetical protein
VNVFNKYYASVGVFEEVYDNMRVHGMKYFIRQKKQQIVLFAISLETRE